MILKNLSLLAIMTLLWALTGCESTKVKHAELTENTIMEHCGLDEGIGGLHVQYHIVEDVSGMDAEFLNDKLYEAYNSDFTEVTGYDIQEAELLKEQFQAIECTQGLHFVTEVLQNEDGFLEIAYELTFFQDPDSPDDAEEYTGEVRLDLNEMMEEWLFIIQQF